MCEKTKNFIERSIAVHGNRYNYDEAVYINSDTKVRISCEKHGVFEQIAYNHLSGKGCKECGKEVRSDKFKKDFIINAIAVHGDKYCYDQTVCVSYKEKVSIRCHIHGIFKQGAGEHLTGRGCMQCSVEAKTEKNFVEKAMEIHGDRYNYENTIYKNTRSKVKITCKKHGDFEQSPGDHLKGQGCKSCQHENQKSDTKSFIKRARLVHGNKYDYSKVVYQYAREKVTIICPKHGEFEQDPGNHINSRNGCPGCSSSKGEISVAKTLNDLGLVFKEQAKFKDCKGKKGAMLKFDFYVESFNLLIEFDGQQHFKQVKAFGGLDKFSKQKENDDIKNIFCECNGISLLRIKYNENVNEAIEKMIKQIKKHGYTCIFYGKTINKMLSFAA